MGRWTRLNSRSRAVALLAAGASAIVLIGLILAVARPRGPTTPIASPTAINDVPTPPSKPSPTTVPLDVTAHLNLGPREATAMSTSPGFVWIATQGVTSSDAGALIRVDATTARSTASWAVGGDPVAVAAAGGFVWVANAPADGASNTPRQNTVEQFSQATGALVHAYQVPDPRGLVANPTSALVISSNPGQRTAISLLASGQTKVVTTLPGTLNVPLSSLSPEVAVAMCSGQAYLALTDVLTASSNVTIYALQPSDGSVREVVTILNDYEASMACDTTSLFLIGAAGDGDVSVARVTIADGGVTNLWEGPYPVSVASLTGRIWIAYSDELLNQTFLTSLDPVTGLAAAARSVLPAPPSNGDPNILVPGDTGLWLVASLGNQLLHIATG
jgi:hypothetical protein